MAWFCECSQSLHRGGGRVRVALDGRAIPDAVPWRATCYRQDGAVSELPIQRSSFGSAVELLLERWECAVIRS